MVDLTPAAATKLRSIISTKGLTGYGLRVYVSGGGCGGIEYGLGFDKTRNDDIVETAGGIQVLVDPFSAEHLEGTKIDFSEEAGGFRIENPNAVAGCNCGAGERSGGCRC